MKETKGLIERLEVLREISDNFCNEDCKTCKVENECRGYCDLYNEFCAMDIVKRNGDGILEIDLAGKKVFSNIDTIYSITYDEVRLLRLYDMFSEKHVINEHEVFFIDLGGYFGLSALVFRNKKHLYYADDFELHYSNKSETELKNLYLKSMKNKVFSDSQLKGELSSYEEYNKKDRYLRNFWIQQFDHVSAFYIGKDEEKEIEKKKSEYPFYNRFSFCYMNDESIIDKQAELFKYLNLNYKKFIEDDESFRKAIRNELWNYEACISYRYEEAVSSLGFDYEKLSPERKAIVKYELDKCINEYLQREA